VTTNIPCRYRLEI